MNYEEAVQSIWRHSEAALSDEETLLKEIVRHATLAPSGHNTQSWRFRIENRSIAILLDLSRRTPVVDPDDHHLYVSLGCAAENLVQAARAFGFMGNPEFSSSNGGLITIGLERSKEEKSPLFKAIPIGNAHEPTLMANRWLRKNCVCSKQREPGMALRLSC